MRIVRYELELVDYQQVQPLWPGRILSIKPARFVHPFNPQPAAIEEQRIDMWCVDAEIPAGEVPPTQVPVLGVWIVGTGNPIPDDLARYGSCLVGGYPRHLADYREVPLDDVISFQDTCVMANGLVWHVFTKTVGYVHPPEVGYGQVSSVDDIAAKVAERRRDELQRVADMPRGTQDRHA